MNLQAFSEVLHHANAGELLALLRRPMCRRLIAGVRSSCVKPRAVRSSLSARPTAAFGGSDFRVGIHSISADGDLKDHV